MSLTITRPAPIIALPRPRVCINPLAGTVNVALHVNCADRLYVVTVSFDRDELTLADVLLEPTPADDPGTPLVLYAALTDLWSRGHAAMCAMDPHMLGVWQGAYTAVAQYRTDWLDAQACDLEHMAAIPAAR